jgi:hypothetical protein
MPDIRRLVEVKGVLDGSGFLIADRLILTAWHLLRPPAGKRVERKCRVRIEGDIAPEAPPESADRIADLLWPLGEPGEDLDFALLGLPQDGSAPRSTIGCSGRHWRAPAKST